VLTPRSDPSAGEICCHLTGDLKINSHVSFHLKALREAGLIKMERKGKFMVCSPNRQALGKLASFFENATRGSECCEELRNAN
jgi:hypothetical protein